MRQKSLKEKTFSDKNNLKKKEAFSRRTPNKADLVLSKTRHGKTRAPVCQWAFFVTGKGSRPPPTKKNRRADTPPAKDHPAAKL